MSSLQSGEEKALRKQLRKEEKRQAKSVRREGGGGGGGTEDHVALLRAQGFDPEELRKHRYSTLCVVQWNLRIMDTLGASIVCSVFVPALD